MWILIALLLGFSAPVVEAQGRGAAKKVKQPVQALKARIRVPVRPVAPRTALRQKPNTIVKKWTTGNGEGHSIVFLHGLGGVPEGPMIKTILQGLDGQNVSATVHAPLLREVTTNDRGEVTGESLQTMSEQLRHAREVIRSQPGKVVLFGHSFGAKAALVLAREFPDKVSKVIAVAPSVKMLHSYWKSLSGERGLADAGRMNTVLVAHGNKLRGKLERTQDVEVAEQLREAIKYNTVMRDLIEHNEVGIETNMPVPTVVFHGAKDAAVSIHYVRRFAEANQKVNLVTYKNHDHHLMGPSAKASKDVRMDVARHIAEFLER